MGELIAKLDELWGRSTEIWSVGGWAMYAMAAVALLMFGLGIRTWLSLGEISSHHVPEATWRRWIEHPEERGGYLGKLLEFTTGGESLRETADCFEHLRMTETAPVERDLRLMRVCVAALPLMGLLGTVTGMLSTFEALASGTSGHQTLSLVASGISEALVTTETGLVIALPGLFFQYHLSRGLDGYNAFLAHLETVCAQTLFRRQNDSENRKTRGVTRTGLVERTLATAGC